MQLKLRVKKIKKLLMTKKVFLTIFFAEIFRQKYVLTLSTHLKTEDMKNILVPTDFSSNAQKALNHAVQLAVKAKAKITLLHAVETFPIDEAIASASQKLEMIKKSIQSSENIAIDVQVEADASVNFILHAIDEFSIDLVVMGTLGNASLKEKIFGSRTAVVIEKCKVPILVIPLLSEWKKPQKILLAINKFEIDDEVLTPAIKIATLFQSSIQVTIFTDTDDDYVEDYKLHEKNIIAFREKLHAQYPTLEIHAVHLAGKHFRESLQQWIEENKIDILVMLTYKRNIIESIFNSSMTKKMSYHSDIPLLAVPVAE